MGNSLSNVGQPSALEIRYSVRILGGARFTVLNGAQANLYLADYMEYGIVHLDITEHAVQDLNQLWVGDPAAASAVVVVLEQLEADAGLVDKLTTYGDNPVGQNRINVKRWENAKSRGNLWRFRILDTPATVYRVVYGYHWQTRQLCVLAIVHKDGFNYDDLNSSLAQRILADWRAI